MSYKGDAAGFLIGKAAADLMAKLAKNQDLTNELLAQMRQDTNLIQGQVRTNSWAAVAAARRASRVARHGRGG